MSFLGRLFGGAKASEQLVENLSNGIDKLVYTSEEKAEDAAQARREGYQVYMSWLESTSGSRIARRLLALIVTLPWALAHFVSMVLGAIKPFIDEGAEKFAQAADALSTNANQNNELIGVVLLFYFGGPVAIEGVKGLVNKWVDKKGE